MTPERMLERDANLELATRIARALSAETGEEWKAPPPRKDYEDDYRNSISLVNAKRNARIWAWLTREPGRLSWHGDWPQGVRRDSRGEVRDTETFRPYRDAPHITTSATLPVERIAKDLARRFLPPYLECLAKMVEQKERWLADENLRDELSKQIAAMLGVELREPHGGYRGETRVYFTRGTVGGHFKLNGGGRVTVELSASNPAFTLKLAGFLAREPMEKEGSDATS